jgi:hypothetical protein
MCHPPSKHATNSSTPVYPNQKPSEHLVARDNVVDTERNAVQVATVGLVRASTVEDQLVLGVADVDALVVGRARVSARGRAGGRGAGALRLGDGLAVRDGSNVGALAAIRAGSNGLEWRQIGFILIRHMFIGL